MGDSVRRDWRTGCARGVLGLKSWDPLRKPGEAVSSGVYHLCAEKQRDVPGKRPVEPTAEPHVPTGQGDSVSKSTTFAFSATEQKAQTTPSVPGN